MDSLGKKRSFILHPHEMFDLDPIEWPEAIETLIHLWIKSNRRN
jgi:hypothetical protein